MLLRLKLWLISVVPILGKHLDVTAACCGGCPTCIGAAGTGFTLDVIQHRRSVDDDE